MTIGILTYHKSPNYGALWQAYALSTFLYDKGYDTSVIDYWPEYHKRMYEKTIIDNSVFNSLSVMGKAKYAAYSCIVHMWNLLRQKRTDRFVRQHLRLTNSHHFDICIYGSDQIWRKQHREGCESYNPVYFGNDYIKAPIKIAYAASMGKIEIESEEDKKFIQSSLSVFHAIGVREQDIKNALSNYTNQPITITADPVFLLTRSQWDCILSKDYSPKSKYIFYYNLEEYPLAGEIVSLLNKKYKLPVIEVKGYVREARNSRSKTQTASPIAFLILLHNAEYVVTSAFHGIALALCFNKQFYYAAPDELAGRVQNLLSKFNLRDRRITDASVFKCEQIDYTKINPLIEEYRHQSQNWLIENISTC